jgi:hypothetical protein
VLALKRLYPGCPQTEKPRSQWVESEQTMLSTVLRRLIFFPISVYFEIKIINLSKKTFCLLSTCLESALRNLKRFSCKFAIHANYGQEKCKLWQRIDRRIRVSRAIIPVSINQMAKHFLILNHTRQHKYYAINYQEECRDAAREHPSNLTSMTQKYRKICDSNTRSIPIHTLLKSATYLLRTASISLKKL